MLGFPIALIFAWAFEMTPEGIKREAAKLIALSPPLARNRPEARLRDHRAVGCIAVVYFAVDKFVRVEAEPEQASVAREKSIAVLLFDNLSGDAATQPFTKGIHDDILTQISKIRALKVIARTSHGSGWTRPSASRKLEPSSAWRRCWKVGVQRLEDRVRINVQLIDCKTEAHLWAETYDRELTAANIFSIQSEIAATVADALQATLSPGEQEQLATVPTDNLAAYQAYLLGKQFLAKDTTAATLKAMNYFRQAVELDPGFALAHVGLADGYIFQNYFGGLSPKEMLGKAQAATETALRLDEKLGEAHSSLATIRYYRNDREGAEAALQASLGAEPELCIGLLLVRHIADPRSRST